MDFIDILKGAIGYKISINLRSVYVNEHNLISTSDDLYICISDTKKVIDYFLVKDTSDDFEDEFDNYTDGFVNQEEPIDYKMTTKYSIQAKKTDISTYANLPVRINNSFFEMTEVEVYKMKIGNRKAEYEKLNLKMKLSPELYVIKFIKGDELIIHYDDFGPQKNIFLSRNSFNKYIESWNKSLVSDFELVMKIL